MTNHAAIPWIARQIRDEHPEICILDASGSIILHVGQPRTSLEADIALAALIVRAVNNIDKLLAVAFSADALGHINDESNITVDGWQVMVRELAEQARAALADAEPKEVGA